MSNFRRRLMMSVNKDNPQKEYTEVEYVESTGKQYIDVGVNAESGLTSEVELYAENTYSDSCIVGSRAGATKFYMCYHWQNSSCISYPSTIKTATLSSKEWHTIKTTLKTGEQTQIIDGETIYSATSNKVININRNLYAFCLNYSGSTNFFFTGKVKYIKLWKDDVLVRDMIPVKDKQGVACMYDKVEQKFYYSATTTDFIAGEEI